MSATTTTTTSNAQPPPTPTGLASLPAKPPPTINTSRASLGPSERLRQPLSPRTGVVPPSARPTSELLGAGNFVQPTPETEAIDQWFENLQNYEATLEEMAAASLDQNFKEELNAIEEWFRVLSEAERTAALYSLLQSATQVQIRFFIQVLQQMARADPMTALLSPGISGSMQGQMEAKLSQLGLKSPGLKAPSSPAVRNFSNSSAANRASFGGDPSAFLSPDSAALGDAAQQRSKLKAVHANHRISAPGLMNSGNSVWTAGSLSNVIERQSSPAHEPPLSPGVNLTSTATRPKSTDFAGLANALRSPRPAGNGSSSDETQDLSPMVSGNWASMVNTPAFPMFPEPQQQQTQANGLDAVTAKLAGWSGLNGNGEGQRVPLMDDAKKFRRKTPANGDEQTAGLRAANGNNNNNNAAAAAALAAQASWRQANADFANGLSGLSPNMNALGMGGLNGLAGLNGMGMGMGAMSPLAANMAGMGLNGMNQMDLLNMNFGNMGMNLNMNAQAQLIAAQLAASGYGGLGSAQGLKFPGLQVPLSANSGRSSRAGRPSPSGRSAFSGKESSREKGEEDVDPNVLEDVPAWLRSLRLHKYTPNFEGMNWRVMVMMDEAALEKKGVAALGARRKMLKTFEVVRAKMGIPEPAGNTTISSAASESDASTFTPQ